MGVWLQSREIVFLFLYLVWTVLDNVVLLKHKRLGLVLLVQIADHLSHVLDFLCLTELAYILCCKVLLHQVLRSWVCIDELDSLMILLLGVLAGFIEPFVRVVSLRQIGTDAFGSGVGPDFKSVLRLYRSVATMQLIRLYNDFGDCSRLGAC